LVYDASLAVKSCPDERREQHQIDGLASKSSVEKGFILSVGRLYWIILAAE
jgi:hypothetical protein